MHDAASFAFVNKIVSLNGMNLCRLSRQHWLCKKQGVLLLFLNVFLLRWLPQQQQRFKFRRLESGLDPIAVDRSVGIVSLKIIFTLICVGSVHSKLYGFRWKSLLRHYSDADNS